MILHWNCPLCNSASLKSSAIDTKRKGPHISRVQFDSCKLVFVNPMADQQELLDYFRITMKKLNRVIQNLFQVIEVSF